MNITERSLLELNDIPKILHQRALSHKLYLFWEEINPQICKPMKSVCGLDVHKDSVYLCILSEFGELIEKVFGVFTYQLEGQRLSKET